MTIPSATGSKNLQRLGGSPRKSLQYMSARNEMNRILTILSKRPKDEAVQRGLAPTASHSTHAAVIHLIRSILLEISSRSHGRFSLLGVAFTHLTARPSLRPFIRTTLCQRRRRSQSLAFLRLPLGATLSRRTHEQDFRSTFSLPPPLRLFSSIQLGSSFPP